jgi:acetate kinase
MNILVLNCGSSSIKYQVLTMQSETSYHLLAKGLLERVGLSGSIISHIVPGKDKLKKECHAPNHTAGINVILELLSDQEHGVVKSLNEITAVGHRVAHGGEYFTNSARVTPDVCKKIEACIDLAPLHNPANLKGILAIESIMPQVPQVAVFDTSFHQTIPAHAYMYALPYKYYEQYKVRRYGFHGTSHRYVAQKACQILGVDMADKKIITCHLGNGASIAAIDKGKSVDTSMGFTPLEGLVMGTRSGDVDAGILPFIADKENKNIQDINNVLNKESGMFGVSGVSSDMRDIETAAAQKNERAQLALDMFYYRILKYVGAYAAAMSGVDIILFTGGIGENDVYVRQYVGERLKFMGVDFDQSLNEGVRGQDKLLTRPGSPVQLMTVTTDEELVIATDTFKLTATK